MFIHVHYFNLDGLTAISYIQRPLVLQTSKAPIFCFEMFELITQPVIRAPYS